MSKIDAAQVYRDATRGSQQTSAARQVGSELSSPPVSANRRRAETPIQSRTMPFSKLEASTRIFAALVEDLAPFSGINGDALIADLTRVELILADEFEENSDPHRKAEIELGRMVLAEQIRRLRLAKSAGDALVSK